MKQSKTSGNPILDIVSRIVSIKADLNDIAFLDSVHLLIGEFGEFDKYEGITNTVCVDKWGGAVL